MPLGEAIQEISYPLFGDSEMLCREGNISNEHIKAVSPTADNDSEKKCYYSTAEKREHTFFSEIIKTHYKMISVNCRKFGQNSNLGVVSLKTSKVPLFQLLFSSVSRLPR